MGIETDETIAERTRIAEERMAEQGWFGRAKSKTGLFIANTLDKWDGWKDNKALVFSYEMSQGAIFGTLAGLVAGMLILAIFNPLGAGLVMLGCMAGGAVGFTIHDGQRGLENNLYNRDKKLSDSIAEKLGAVPEKGVNITKNPKEMLHAAGYHSPLLEQVERTLAENGNAPGFAARERVRVEGRHRPAAHEL